MHSKYPSKLLLFGEYLVLQQGAALAIPDERYQTQWVKKEKSDPEMVEYLTYLKDQEFLKSYLNFNRLEKHLNAGWKLESNIPRHVGLGSSASFVAAVYDRYKTKKDAEVSMSQFQQIFSLMENYMHGTSSGFDPLPIYFRQPILRKNNQSVLVSSKISCLDQWTLELIDSGSPREKNHWIQKFLDKVKADKEFATRIDTLTKVNNKMVEAVIKNEKRIAENLLTTYSENQYYLFDEWIPESMKIHWEESMKDPNYIVKILGAGGGGFFLKIHFQPDK